MKKLIALQQKRGKLAADMRKVVDATNESTGMTKEQESQWNQMNDDLVNLDKQIVQQEQMASIEVSLKEVPEPAPRQEPNSPENKSPLNTNDYKNNFNTYLRNTDLGSAIRNALTVGTDTEGGFTVPDSWLKTLINSLTDNVVMRDISTVIQTSSTTNLPLVSDNGSAAWLDEGAAYPESDIVFGAGVIEAWKSGRIIKVSEELLQDSVINLEAEISRIFGLTFGLLEEDGFINGNGIKKPTGVLVTAQNGKTAAANNAITYDEIIDLKYSLRETYRKGGLFLMASSTAGMLRKLKSTDGIPLWQPSIQLGQPDMFDGSPVRTAETVPAVGSATTPIAFGDFRHYRIADRGGVVMQRLNELYAGTGHVGFRMRKRVDGKLLVAESIKKLTMAV